MKKITDTVLADNILKFSTLLSFMILLFVSGIIAISYANLPPYVPFFNSLPWGTERLFSSIVVIVLPLAFLFVIIVNILLSAHLYTKHALMARMVSFNGLLVMTLGFLAYLQIMLLVL
jgi:hypothetical protein